MRKKIKKKIIILGGASLLSYLWCNEVSDEFEIYLVNNLQTTRYLKFPVLKVDLNSSSQFASLLEIYKIDIVVNTIGLTNVENCEADPDKAYFLNSILPGKIAKACFLAGKKLIHISTDHFYSDQIKIHTEEDKVSLVNIYAKSKYEGEINVLDNLSSALICRTNFFGYGPPHKKSFSDWIINAVTSQESIVLHNDVFYTPISSKNLAKISHELLDLNCCGIHNISSDNKISKYEFAVNLCEHLNISTKNIFSESIKNRSELMLRPTSMALSNKKISGILKKSIGGIENQIESIFNKVRI